jgi:hypothetical protein
MIRHILAFFALAALAIAPPLATPAFAQSQVGITGYLGSNGAKAAVRPSTPLPTYNQPFAVPASQWTYAGATGGIVNTTPVAVKAAAGAGVRNYLVSVQYFNSAAVASEIEIRDGSTVIWRGFVPASMTVPVSVTFEIPLRGTANTALNVALATTATATRVSAQGFTSTN